jgi:putative membrane protein
MLKIFAALSLASSLAYVGAIEAANPFSGKLTDPVIMKIVMNTNEGEISMANLAETEATNPEVKEFAKEMREEHKAHNNEIMALSKRINVEPSSNVKTEARTLSAEKNVAMLKMKEGKSFDKAYMETQVNAHAKVLEDFNQNLIPNAQDKNLRALLTKSASSVREHLEEAQKIHNSML